MSWLTRLFKPEACETCSVLKEQLRYEQERVSELQKAVIDLLKPNVAVADDPVLLEPIGPKVTLMSRRRRELEKQDRIAAAALKSSTNLGKPDVSQQSIEELEKEVMSK